MSGLKETKSFTKLTNTWNKSYTVESLFIGRFRIFFHDSIITEVIGPEIICILVHSSHN